GHGEDAAFPHMITRRPFDIGRAAADGEFIHNRSGVEVDAITPRFSVNGLKDQRVAARGLAGAQPIPEFRRSHRSPNSFAEMLKRQQYALAGAKSQLDRIAVDVFRASEETGPDQIARVVIKDDPAKLEIGGDERYAHSRAFEQPRIPPVPAVAGVGDETGLR